MSLPLRKSALAASYFPELASHQACNRLRRWIIRCTELYDKLRETDAVDPQEAMRRASAGEDVPLRELLGVVYQCHLDDGTICRGWLADQKRRGLPSLALRLELSRRPDLVRVLEKVDENDPDLYGSLAEMCAANAGQPFPESNPRARKLLRLKQRGNRKKKPRSRRR